MALMNLFASTVANILLFINKGLFYDNGYNYLLIFYIKIIISSINCNMNFYRPDAAPFQLRFITGNLKLVVIS